MVTKHTFVNTCFILLKRMNRLLRFFMLISGRSANEIMVLTTSKNKDFTYIAPKSARVILCIFLAK